jgi:23S rRNA pseudouridine2457 synthase
MCILSSAPAGELPEMIPAALPRRNEVGAVTTVYTHSMVLLLLNKPFGVVSQFSGSDCTLADHVQEQGVYPAGRLDRDSEGLLLLTDDGKLQARISQPRYKLAKKYWVQVEGTPDSGQLDRLRNGITLKDGRARALSVEIIDAPATLWDRVPPIRERRNIPTHWLDLSIDEGRNRQVRRMTAAVDLPTLRLIRHQVGPWKLAGLRPGELLRIEGQQAWDALRA